jgi:hypothetical protein
MNSFKASNDLKYNAIDDITQGDGAGDKGSAMKMNQAPTMKKGAMYMKDDMAPKMEKGSAAHMKGDLDKDGKMSGYESKRQAAIEKNMKK